MEFQSQLENIDKKITEYNEKVEELSSVVRALAHSFGQNQLSSIKSDILFQIENKLDSMNPNTDINEIKDAFASLNVEFEAKKQALDEKISELEIVIAKMTSSMETAAPQLALPPNAEVEEKLTQIKTGIYTLMNEISEFKNQSPAIQTMTLPDGTQEHIESLQGVINSQIIANEQFYKNIEKQFEKINDTVKSINAEVEVKADLSQNPELIKLEENLNEFAMAVNAVLTSLKIIDIKCKELEDFQTSCANLEQTIQTSIDNLSQNLIEPIKSANDESFKQLHLLRENDGKHTQQLDLIEQVLKKNAKKITDDFEGIKGIISTNSQSIISNFEDVKGLILDIQPPDLADFNNNIKEVIDGLKISIDDFKHTVDLNDSTLSGSLEKIETSVDSIQEKIHMLPFKDDLHNIETILNDYKESLNELSNLDNSADIKEEIKNLNNDFSLQLVSLFDNISFLEESEDIKDFIDNVKNSINNKTSENSEKLNDIIFQFKALINKIDCIEKAQKTITEYLNQNDKKDDIYSFDDIQSDFAKMRLVLHEISQSASIIDFANDISSQIKQTHEQIDNFSQMIAQNSAVNENAIEIKEKIYGMQELFEKLDAQVYDISLRTNKLILSSEDSTNELKSNLQIFKEIVDKSNPEKLYGLFYEYSHYFGDINQTLSDISLSVLETQNDIASVKNALTYVGEWLDSAGTTLREIKEKPDVAPNIQVDNTDVKQSLSDLAARMSLFEQKIEMKMAAIEEKADKLLNTETPNSNEELVESVKKLITISKLKDKIAKPDNGLIARIESLDERFATMEAVLLKLNDMLIED
ncbi:MAG: hypothetical protein PHX18_01365 [Candidatus Gastranaerophilales bacterium]|nr:hypothetical protein [Candidatus Gastranaerophilales bacterium]